MNKYFTLFAVSLSLITISANTAAQQQPLYSQYVFNGVVINPAHIATENEYTNITLMHRQQWIGIPGAPKTYTLSFSVPINATKTSIGVLAVQDEAAVDTQKEVNILLAQNITLEENVYLAVGASAGISVFQEDNLRLNAHDDIMFNKNLSSTRANVGFGVTFFTEHFFLGVSAPAFRKLTVRTVPLVQGNKSGNSIGKSSYYLSSGYLWDISPTLKIKPTALLKKIGEEQITGEMTVNFLLNNIIWIGAGWRQGESIMGITQFQLTNSLKLCYSYDYITKRELQTIQDGSHEISCSFRFGSKGRIVSPSYF